MILVTGGTGLLGSHLLLQLVQQGKKVRMLYRSEESKKNLFSTFAYYTTNPSDLIERIDFVKGDVLDIFSLIDALKDVTQVYHCAALVSFAPQDAERITKINVDGTANLVNACLELNIKKFCHVSSVAALGKAAPNTEVTEETFWKSSPENSVYSISKYSSEREVWRGVQEGLTAIVVNPTVILGPGDLEKGSSSLFRSARKGMKFYTEGITGFVDVRDVVSCMIQLMEGPVTNERFVLNSENIAFRSFFETANTCFNQPKPSVFAGKWISEFVWRLEKIRSSVSGSSPLITKETTRAAHQKKFFSSAKIKSVLGISFIPVEQSIKETAALLLKQ